MPAASAARELSLRLNHVATTIRGDVVRLICTLRAYGIRQSYKKGRRII
jgi:hypothetical protein